MTPPQLTRDTPVLDVLQPVLIGVHVFLWIELQFTIEHGRQSDVSKVLHIEEPLQRETGLNGGVGVTLRVAYLVDVVLNLLHQTGFLQVLGNLLAAVEAVHTDIERTLLRDGTISIEDIDGLQVVGLAQHVVVGVVSRGHLQATRTELDIHVAVLDNGNHAVHQRNNHLLALQPLVLRVLGVDTHSGITHDGLRTRGGYDSVVAAVVFMDDISFLVLVCCDIIAATLDIILQVEQMTLLFLVNNLLSREGGQCLGVPVDHAQTTIDESLVVEVNKHLDNTLRALLVHREGGAVPVAAGT